MKRIVAALAVLSLTLTAPVSAQKRYDTGASDTEIRIGQTMPSVDRPHRTGPWAAPSRASSG